MWARTSSPFHGARLVTDVDAVGARVLADDQQLLGARGDQFLGFAQDRVGPAADEVAAKVRDDAEGAAVVAALRNLQIAVVARRELEPAFRHEVEEGVAGIGAALVNRADNLLIFMRRR